ncbi:MAG: type phosphodiesterase/nucleotide pyrophosphatase, partial [Gemmatimonadetes bacterium]|nr:type phosphodiesterase/nucleotide pyrophosphatase [Gemmatimonadota bacterium]
MRHLLLTLVMAGAVPAAACAQAAGSSPASAAQAAPSPRLVVFIAVDQMRADYFERFGSQFTGGLKRLYEGSAFYSKAEQDHAIVETAPGHSTMLSGRSPASTNIVTNEFGVPDTLSPLLGIPGPGASPRRFRGTTLYDWMKAADPDVRVLSVSRKDRGAILPIGRAKVPVFWYQSGYFTTSTWYGTELPRWLRSWNGRKGATSLMGKSWDLLKPASSYPEPDAEPWERGGNNNVFPHRIPDDPDRAVLEVLATPWMDSLTMDLALEGAKQLKLGQRDRPDLLSVSLSTTDAVGHVYGPDSREMHDHLLRVDHWLGIFMDSLETSVGKGRILWALTADHGVTPFPERTRANGHVGGRAVMDTVVFYANQDLLLRYSKSVGVEFNNGILIADTTVLHQAGANVDSIASALASQIARTTGVTRIYTPRILAAASPDDLDAMRWRRSIPADFEWLAAASLAPGYIWSYTTASTTHGTTNVDDIRVPMLFMGAGITPGKYDRGRTATSLPPRTVDI